MASGRDYTERGESLCAPSDRVIWAYAGRRSVVAGETVDLHLSSPSGVASVEIVRDGAQPRGVFQARTEHCGPYDLGTGAVENGCAWPVALSVLVGRDWASGIYLVRCSDRDLAPSATAYFVVRSLTPAASRLLVLGTATYNAYNGFGGTNTYSATSASRTGPASQVSFLRPLPPGFLDKGAFRGRLSNGGRTSCDIPYFSEAAAADLDSNSGAAGWSNWEREFVLWAEQNGLHLDYATSEDLERVPGLLYPYQLMLSVGHLRRRKIAEGDLATLHTSCSA